MEILMNFLCIFQNLFGYVFRYDAGFVQLKYENPPNVSHILNFIQQTNDKSLERQTCQLRQSSYLCVQGLKNVL